MTPEQICRITDMARAFLIDRLSEVLNPSWGEWWAAGPEAVLAEHLSPVCRVEAVSLEDIMARLLVSAQNRQDAANVILGSVPGHIDGLRDVLGGLDPQYIRSRWKSSEALLDYLVQSGQLRGAIRRGAKSRWPQFCKSILSAAEFLSRFESADEFRAWLFKFRADPDLSAALPLVLAQEIKGFGLALASDFLKELGCDEFGKPDVHTKALLTGTGISNATTDYMLLRDLIRAAEAIGVTPYEFDKIFWLIGSGNFYRAVNEDGESLRIGRQRRAFLDHLAHIGDKVWAA